MTAVLPQTDLPRPGLHHTFEGGDIDLDSPRSTPHRDRSARRHRRIWNGFTAMQLSVMGLASVAPALILGAIGLALAGAITVESMIEFALGAGENPGMIIFGAMFMASPVQWLTGRSQVWVRKYLAIAFFLLALSNAGMFVLETGIAAALSAPLLIAGTVAFSLAVPLFLTSSRRAQRAMGMSSWRTLHKLTYLIAVALLAHVLLIGDLGPGSVLIALGFVARIPALRRRLRARAARRNVGTP